ncbi:hypothetical protein AMAG_19649 [Allomyces macrogynus ATCC 38327]|uniref:Anaphase-promoting complex subunit 4 WD40 domain-containing protein n=1 Tax=Allomyces macrogynus (strain ATCC 38327) TaxID=578462 RepID=A0A0L0SWX6_ALLM3|nr:hypothetical protein AMAG_19649 [Allomyces macrogynus ATCC 38327]|eukprot:KNE67053.1 hypothetical protein AMAG_19649 [Allomyces macrogynus ATCC 38327]
MTALPHVNLLPPLAKAKDLLFSVNGEYIFDVVATQNAMAVSASDNQIKIYDPLLNLQGSLIAHTGTISNLTFLSTDPNTLISSARDGNVFAWDLRRPQAPVLAWKAPNRQSILSHAVSPAANLLAAGTELTGADAYIHFYDLRHAETPLMHTFSESVADDVTQLHFHPSVPTRLLSGSTDGVACVFDLVHWDEDEDLVGSMPSGSSVNKVGWFGPAGEYVWMSTHIETFSVWSAEGDLLKDFGDVRQHSTASTPIDYVVDCEFDPATQRLYMAAGSHSGSLSLLHVSLDGLQHCQTLPTAHTDVVRSVALDFTTGQMVSGGEDAKLALWKRADDPTVTAAPVLTPTPAATRPAPARLHQARKAAAPYSR